MHSVAADVVAGGRPSAAPPALHLAAWVGGLFAAAIVCSYVGLLGHFALAEPDEPRYAEIAREMIELRDWVTPHLNYVKYFEKPPLIYWLTAINFELFGLSEFVVRLWPALFGLLGIGVAYVLGRTMYGAWVGAVAGGLLATTPLYFGLSQIVILDMPLSVLMAVALGAFWFAYAEARWRRPCVLLLYAATGLGVLTKGPVAVLLTGAIIVAFLFVRGDFAALRWAVSPLGAVVLLIIVLPWFVLVSQRNSEFIDFFLIKQHVDRFLRPDEHQEPLWFFVPIVFGGMLPWTAFVLMAPRLIFQVLGRIVTRRASPATLYCVLWAGTVFTFFSLSGSKLATYILPMFCPMAILAACFFAHVVQHGRTDLLRRGCIVLLVLAIAIVLGAAIAGESTDAWIVTPLLPRLYIGSAVLFCTALAALWLARQASLQASLATLLFGVLVLQVVAISGRGIAAHYRPLGVFVRTHAARDDLVLIYRHYVQGITFYGQRRTIMVGGRGELDFGSRQGDQRAFFWDDDTQLLDAWRSARHVFLVINRSELEPLQPRMQPGPRQVAAHGKKVIVVNFN